MESCVELCAQEIQAFQGAHAGGTNSDNMPEVVDNCLDSGLRHRDNLRMHGMLVGICHLHGLEGTCTNMQGHLRSLYAPLAQTAEHIICEMQTRSRSRHRTFNARINGLISCLVAFLRLAIEVWRNRQFAYGIKNLSKTEV